MSIMVEKAVIIGESAVIRLCTARCVGAAGYSVDIIRIGRKKGRYLKTPDYYSKYVDKYYYYDETVGISLSDFLIQRYPKSNQKPVLFTLGDKTTYLVDKERIILKDYFLFAHLRKDGSLSVLMDKHLMKKEAESVGLSVVKGWPIDFDGVGFTVPDNILYPCFVKGRYSYWNSKRIQKKCDNREDLASLIQLCKTVYPHSLYAEEYVDVEKEMGIMGICDGERCVIPAETELVVMGEGSSHGVSILGCVKPLDKGGSLKTIIEDLLCKLGYRGIFNIDFIVTNNNVYFVEMNLRFATYGYGIFKSGINIPALFVRVLDNTKVLDDGSFGTIDNQHYYLNEEVAFNSIIERKLSLKKYKEIKKRASIFFVQSADDPSPMIHLRRWFIIKYLVMLINQIKK